MKQKFGSFDLRPLALVASFLPRLACVLVTMVALIVGPTGPEAWASWPAISIIVWWSPNALALNHFPASVLTSSLVRAPDSAGLRSGSSRLFSIASSRSVSGATA